MALLLLLLLILLQMSHFNYLLLFFLPLHMCRNLHPCMIILILHILLLLSLPLHMYLNLHPPPLHHASHPHASPYSIDPPPTHPLVPPSIDHRLSPSPHVSSSIDDLLPPLPPNVSRDFDGLEIMFTSGTIVHIHDIDIETLDSGLFPIIIYEIVLLIEALPLVA